MSSLILTPGIPEIQELPVGAAWFHQPVAEDTQDHRRQVRNQRPVLLQLSEVAFEVQHFLIYCDLQLHHNPSVYCGQKEHSPVHRTGIFHWGGKFSFSLTWSLPPWKPRDTPCWSPFQTSHFFLGVSWWGKLVFKYCFSYSPQKWHKYNMEFLSLEVTVYVVQSPLSTQHACACASFSLF